MMKDSSYYLAEKNAIGWIRLSTYLPFSHFRFWDRNGLWTPVVFQCSTSLRNIAAGAGEMLAAPLSWILMPNRMELLFLTSVVLTSIFRTTNPEPVCSCPRDMYKTPLNVPQLLNFVTDRKRPFMYAALWSKRDLRRCRKEVHGVRTLLFVYYYERFSDRSDRLRRMKVSRRTKSFQ